MAIVSAAVTQCAHTTFEASAEWKDEDLLKIFNSVRFRKGKIPSGEVDENDHPILRDLTNEECARFMVGSMMSGWSQNAADDEAQILKAQAAEGVKPATWKTLS